MSGMATLTKGVQAIPERGSAVKGVNVSFVLFLPVTKGFKS